MNTNRDSSINTRLKMVRMISAHNMKRMSDVNSGLSVIPRFGVSNKDSSLKIDIFTGNQFYTEEIIPIPASPSVTYIPVLSYAYFLTPGTTTWTSPATLVSPITYWIIGGGGGGGGAHDGGGAGGGGGGMAITGTYAISPGQTYSIVVGDGGAGGLGMTGTGTLPPLLPNDTPNNTSGLVGGDSSFDLVNSGPQALGGGSGFHSRYGPNGIGIGGAAATVSTSSLGGNRSNISGGIINAGGGGGSLGAGGDGTSGNIGTGGSGTPYTIVGVNSGNSVTYGVGGDGGRRNPIPRTNGASGSVNTGNGGGGASTPFSSGANGGNGGSGLVVIQFYA